ncbi:uncharacterized protein VTP21DRAFT_7891 [Calcarisporiella thermophila]|uniref:uncharacterized protein n=1 Tax=Calcarisporiella thermophila TaxID=911321 RepID=UPI0037444D96
MSYCLNWLQSEIGQASSGGGRCLSDQLRLRSIHEPVGTILPRVSRGDPAVGPVLLLLGVEVWKCGLAEANDHSVRI